MSLKHSRTQRTIYSQSESELCQSLCVLMHDVQHRNLFTFEFNCNVCCQDTSTHILSNICYLTRNRLGGGASEGLLGSRRQSFLTKTWLNRGGASEGLLGSSRQSFFD